MSQLDNDTFLMIKSGDLMFFGDTINLGRKLGKEEIVKLDSKDGTKDKIPFSIVTKQEVELEDFINA